MLSHKVESVLRIHNGIFGFGFGVLTKINEFRFQSSSTLYAHSSSLPLDRDPCDRLEMTALFLLNC